LDRFCFSWRQKGNIVVVSASRFSYWRLLGLFLGLDEALALKLARLRLWLRRNHLFIMLRCLYLMLDAHNEQRPWLPRHVEQRGHYRFHSCLFSSSIDYHVNGRLVVQVGGALSVLIDVSIAQVLCPNNGFGILSLSHYLDWFLRRDNLDKSLFDPRVHQWFRLAGCGHKRL